MKVVVVVCCCCHHRLLLLLWFMVVLWLCRGRFLSHSVARNIQLDRDLIHTLSAYDTIICYDDLQLRLK